MAGAGAGAAEVSAGAAAEAAGVAATPASSARFSTAEQRQVRACLLQARERVALLLQRPLVRRARLRRGMLQALRRRRLLAGRRRRSLLRHLQLLPELRRLLLEHGALDRQAVHLPLQCRGLLVEQAATLAQHLRLSARLARRRFRGELARAEPAQQRLELRRAVLLEPQAVSARLQLVRSLVRAALRERRRRIEVLFAVA